MLVSGAVMPRAEELPESLAELSRRHAVELTPARFARDMQRIVRVLDRSLASPSTVDDVPAPPSDGAPAPVTETLPVVVRVADADVLAQPDGVPILAQATTARGPGDELGTASVVGSVGSPVDDTATPGVETVGRRVDQPVQAAIVEHLLPPATVEAPVASLAAPLSATADPAPMADVPASVVLTAPVATPWWVGAVLAAGALVLVIKNWPPPPGAQRAWLHTGSGTAVVRTWHDILIAAPVLALAGAVGARRWPALRGAVTAAAAYLTATSVSVICGGLANDKDAPKAPWVVTLLIATGMLAVVWLTIRPERAPRGRPTALAATPVLVGAAVIAGQDFVAGIPDPSKQLRSMRFLVYDSGPDVGALVALVTRPVMFVAIASLVLFQVGGRTLRTHHLAAAGTVVALGALDVVGATLMDRLTRPTLHLSGTLIAVALTGLAIYAVGIAGAVRRPATPSLQSPVDRYS